MPLVHPQALALWYSTCLKQPPRRHVLSTIARSFVRPDVMQRASAHSTRRNVQVRMTHVPQAAQRMRARRRELAAAVPDAVPRVHYDYTSA